LSRKGREREIYSDRLEGEEEMMLDVHLDDLEGTILSGQRFE